MYTVCTHKFIKHKLYLTVGVLNVCNYSIIKLKFLHSRWYIHCREKVIAYINIENESCLK